MQTIQIHSAWQGTSDCRHCTIRDMVLFADLNEEDFSLIHSPIDDLEFKAKSALYGEGSPARGVFTLRSGMLKLTRAMGNGTARVVRVLRPGDVAGLEALASAQYDSDAVALTDVSVCRIPLEVIHTLGRQSPRLHQRLMEKWHGALKGADDWLADLNSGTARQRVSEFILKMRADAQSDHVTLFAREDMGAMLNLSMETVSRMVSTMVQTGVLEPLDKIGRNYRILQLPVLLSERFADS